MLLWLPLQAIPASREGEEGRKEGNQVWHHTNNHTEILGLFDGCTPTYFQKITGYKGTESGEYGGSEGLPDTEKRTASMSSRTVAPYLTVLSEESPV